MIDDKLNKTVKDATSFQDLLREEFDIDNAVDDDELDEDQEMLDLIITDYDERKSDQIETAVDEFCLEIDREVEKIIEQELEEAMENFYDFFDEDSEIFEESVDMDIEDIEDIEDPEFEEELDVIDNMEGILDISEEDPISIDN